MTLFTTLSISLPLLLTTAACRSSGDTVTAIEASVFQQKDARPDLKHWNLSKKGLALEGYDPVAYFPDHGGKATEGSEKITTTHRGVTYRFATEENRKAFLEKPARYEPTYGGWCAWAMSQNKGGKGEKVDIDPESFTVENDRLFVFYDGFWADTRKDWKENGGAPKLAAQGDGNWARMTKPKEK
jgi:YHS domain-containing protein